MTYGEEPWRSKRRDETDSEWKMRVIQEEQGLRDRDGPLITPETDSHGDYSDEFVMHAESYTLARTKRNNAVSPIEFLFRRGAIDNEQLDAAEQVEMAHGIITSGVTVRGSNLDARVDNSGASRDALVEQIAMVRLEMTYSRCRRRIKRKPAMIVDMLTGRRSLADIARSHKTGWPRARQLLIDALDAWIEIREKVARDVDQEDLDAAHKRLMYENLKWGA